SACIAVVLPAADQRGTPIARQGDADALLGRAYRAAADQRRSLLRPRRPRAGKHPRSACIAVVLPAADQRGTPIARQGDADALLGRAYRAAADQLRSLLRPRRPRAGKHPRSACIAVVLPAADQRGTPIARQGDADALLGRAYRAAAHK